MRNKPHQHSHPASPELAQRLRTHARKITGPRRAVLEALRTQAHPVTVRELIDGMVESGCDQATVYRSLHVLEEIGFVKRFDFGDGTARFEFVCGEECAHHHHLICTGCARIEEIDDCAVGEFEKRIAAGKGFRAITHKLEFFGICPSCQEK